MHIPPPVPVGEGYYLMESCFFLLLSAFPQTPCLPCQENNESTKPFVRTSTQHFHLRRPPIPKKQPRLHSHLPNVISVLSHFHPPPAPPARLPAHPAPGSTSAAAGFSCFFSTRSRCAQDSLIVRWGGGGGRVIEAVRGRRGRYGAGDWK